MSKNSNKEKKMKTKKGEQKEEEKVEEKIESETSKTKKKELKKKEEKKEQEQTSTEVASTSVVSSPAKTSFYCSVCDKYLSNSGSYINHRKSLKCLTNQESKHLEEQINKSEAEQTEFEVDVGSLRKSGKTNTSEKSRVEDLDKKFNLLVEKYNLLNFAVEELQQQMKKLQENE